MKVSGRAAGLLLASLLGGAAWAEEPRAAVFGPGEQTSYRIQYLGMTAGTAQVTVGAPTKQWGEDVWPIVAIARTGEGIPVYPIRDKFVTYWAATGHPRMVGSDLFADENRKRRRIRIKVGASGTEASVVKQKEGEKPQEQLHTIPLHAFDVAGATFALRNQDLGVGKTYAYPVFTGAKTFTMRAKVESKQTLQTALGSREVFKIRVQTEFSGKLQSKRDIFAYLSTDAAHVPVRLEAEFVLGTIVADLAEYKQGRPLVASGALNTDG